MVIAVRLLEYGVGEGQTDQNKGIRQCQTAKRKSYLLWESVKER